MNKLIAVSLLVFTLPLQAAETETPPQVQSQEDDQALCIQQRTQHCISKCENAGDKECIQLCDTNAKNECLQAGE